MNMNELVDKLQEACVAYYKYDSPIMSDKEYDALYDELEALEKETGIVLAGSPTQKVQGYILDGFDKVTHSKPMLSADKTKSLDDIEKFLSQGYDWYCSGKLDGLTLVTIFENGEFVQGITRGNGIVGEDVTEACHFIKDLPMKIPYKNHLELRGECVISWDEFDRINENLAEKYKHPRNLASGTIRQLDLNVVKDRKLSYVVFECVTKLMDNKWEELNTLGDYGFNTVMRMQPFTATSLKDNIKEVSESMTKMVKTDEYPYDGLIFEINSHNKSEKLGKTDHHENCRMALKWADTTYETVLRDVEWNVGKTGVIFPTGIVDEVDLDGALTSKVTLHNITYIKDLELGIGDTVTIYRSNMVIPALDENLTRSNTIEIPEFCPICSAPTRIVKENKSEVLYCTNDECPGKTLGKWVTFVSKKGMDIDGLSEQTLDKLINFGYLTNMFESVYSLHLYKNELYKIDGFGKKSIDNLLAAIESSKECDLIHFITAFSIPGIGEGQSKLLAKFFKTFDAFSKACDNQYDFSNIPGIGPVLSRNINKWWMLNHMQMIDIAGIVSFIGDDFMNKPDGHYPLIDKTFVITGSVHHYKNRGELQKVIEDLGGKVVGSVSKNTSYLINNDATSDSSKNKKAKDLGIPIITEEEFLELIK